MTAVRRARSLFAALLAGAVVGGAYATAAAQSQGGPSIVGRVQSTEGSPVAAAIVVLRGSGIERSARADRNGRFEIGAIPPGSYAVRVTAAGYEALTNRVIEAGPETGAVTLTLVRSSSSLMTIGRVDAGGGEALSTASAPTTSLDAQAYAALGYTRVSDVLANDASMTVSHPLGGSSLLPTPVVLRGPDPTETLIDIDGHRVNNGNTGDFDLSLLDPADYGSIEIVKGISPSSLVGPDTIDGAINLRTLDPTAVSHGALRLSAGSFDAFGATLEATGTDAALGYAVSLHRTTSAGETNEPIFDLTAGAPARVGSAVDGSTALGKLRYAFGPSGDAYAELSFHDQSQARDLSAALSSIPASGADSQGDPNLQRLDGLEGTMLRAHDVGYGFDARVPLGAPGPGGVAQTDALFRHYSSLVSQSVNGPGADASPYLFNDRDAIGDDTLEIERTFAHASLALQYDVRNEVLDVDFIAGVVNEQSAARRAAPAARRQRLDASPAASGVSTIALGRTQHSAVLRYADDPTSRLHLTAAAYYSSDSTFGTSLDPRFGATYDPDARTVVRMSAGTTYQAPQLPELFVPRVLPALVGGYVSIGNPNLQPDHATEYGFGVEHIFEMGARRTGVSLDLYRVDLRRPAATLLPPLDPNCGPAAAGGDGSACPTSYPVNAGDGVYQGVELSADRRIMPDTTLSAAYAVRSAYLTKIPASIQTGSLVPGEQDAGLPLDKGTLSIRRAPPLGLKVGARLVYEGSYNELDRPPYAVVDADVGYRWPHFEIALAATNLTGTYDQRFTRIGAGVRYGGVAGPIATDAYALQGTALTLTIARRF